LRALVLGCGNIGSVIVWDLAYSQEVEVGGARYRPGSFSRPSWGPRCVRRPWAVWRWRWPGAGETSGHIYMLGPHGCSERYEASVTRWTTALPASIAAQM